MYSSGSKVYLVLVLVLGWGLHRDAEASCSGLFETKFSRKEPHAVFRFPSEVTVVHGNRIRIRGDITEWTYSAIIHALLRVVTISKPIHIEIDSRGGQMNAAFKIARRILQLREGGARVSTEVLPGGQVSSSAIFIYLAGSVRKASVTSMFLFHAPRLDGEPLNATEARELMEPKLRALKLEESFLSLLNGRGALAGDGEVKLQGDQLFEPKSMMGARVLFEGNIVTEFTDWSQ